MLLLDKKIKIPKALHDLHGEENTVGNLLLVYIAAFIGATTVTHYANLLDKSLALWKFGILFVLSLDIFGCVVANFSKSTNEYYSGKKNLQYLFVSLHIFHPLVFWFVFGGSLVI